MTSCFRREFGPRYLDIELEINSRRLGRKKCLTDLVDHSMLQIEPISFAPIHLPWRSS